MSNKVLATRNANQLKGAKTPFEAFGHNQHISKGYCWEDIMKRVGVLPKAKHWRFYEDAIEIWQEKNGGFIDSQLTDTATISKFALGYVKKLAGVNNAWAVTGTMTSELRGRWDLNSLLSDHNQKDRLDHRHHAIDAFVIALTDRKLLHKFMNSLHKDQSGRLLLEGGEIKELVAKVIEPMREQLKEKLETTYVSHKPDHGNNALFLMKQHMVMLKRKNALKIILNMILCTVKILLFYQIVKLDISETKVFEDALLTLWKRAWLKILV